MRIQHRQQIVDMNLVSVYAFTQTALGKCGPGVAEPTQFIGFPPTLRLRRDRRQVSGFGC